MWCRTGEAANALPPELRAKIVLSLPVLGCTLYHHDPDDSLSVGFGCGAADMQKAADHIRSTAEKLGAAVAQGLCCQVAGGILRYVTVGAPQHLLRVRHWTSEALEVYDRAVKEAWESMLEAALSADQVTLGSLPLRDGGAAFGLASHRAAAAYLSGWRRELWSRSKGAPYYTDAALRRDLPALAGDLEAARADILSRAPSLDGDSSLDFTKQPAKQLQKYLTQHVTDQVRAQLFTRLPVEQRAFVRQGGGPGAGGFLLVPLHGVCAMANGPWRMAFRRRLWLSAEQIVAPQVAGTHCLHSGRQGVCGAQLQGPRGVLHAVGCKTGGGIVAGHNELRDILWDFAKAHIDPKALREQHLESLRAGILRTAEPDAAPGDVLDVVFNYNGRRVAIDVAVVGAEQSEARTRAAAGINCYFAGREERGKWRRYDGLSISPCIF